MLEIHQKVNNPQDSYTKPDKIKINKQKLYNRNEPPTSENRKSTLANYAQLKNTEQTLSQEQKVNIQNLKTIINGEKTTLP